MIERNEREREIERRIKKNRLRYKNERKKEG